MKWDFGSLSVFLAALAPALVFLGALFLDHWQRGRVEKSPQSEKLLRPPGHSLSLRLDATIELLLKRLLTASILGAVSGASVFTFVAALGSNAPARYLALSALIALPSLAGCLWATLRAYKLFKEARNIRLGISGEQAVAESLGEAADSGFRAFHDLPGGDNWNIDHVAVGSRGVFLIETKARRRRANRPGQPAHEVIFDGEALQFPTGRDSKPLDQAKRNAAWLANYLDKKTGEPVRVQPLVVLPGWFVRIVQKGNFPVKAMNANYLVRFLQGQPETIAPAQVRRIITALDEKCRDVEF